MKISSFFLALGVVLLLHSSPIRAQTYFSPEDWATLEAQEDTLGVLAYAIINDSLPEYRFGAVRSFIPRLVQTLKTTNSFHYPFEQLKSISIQYAQDSSFRIFTWQLYVDENNYRYYGTIQMNTSELKLFPLVDRSFEMIDNPEQAALTKDNWYGAVYYNILPVVDAPQPYYLLFGFDGYSFFRKRKVVDVLYFKDGQPHFGAPVFELETTDGAPATKHRILLEYSAAAAVTCNYDPAAELLIHDFLTPMQGEYNEGLVNIPDGTYEAYELKNGKWLHINQLENEILEEAPRPEPILDGRGKNIISGGGGN